jgi:hypothetical protein
MKSRCRGLDMNAKRCRREAAGAYYYHGDPETRRLFSDEAAWVVVELCVRCAGPHSRRRPDRRVGR